MSDIRQTSSLTPETKVPIAWVLGVIILLVPVTLYFADVISLVRLNDARTSALDARVKTLEEDVKTELRLMREELGKIARKE